MPNDYLTGTPLPPQPPGRGRPREHYDDNARILNARLAEVEWRLDQLVRDPNVAWAPQNIKRLRGLFYRLANALNAARVQGGKRPAPGRKLGAAARGVAVDGRRRRR